jgi:hypothetical protein
VGQDEPRGIWVQHLNERLARMLCGFPHCRRLQCAHKVRLTTEAACCSMPSIIDTLT